MRILPGVILFLAFQGIAFAQEDKGQVAPGEPKVFASDHTGRFNGAVVNYTATAGETFLKDEDGKPRASIFSVSYVKKGLKDPATRPITFLFNGGPGSASLWLHMGAFGPKRVAIPSDATEDGAPPYNIIDNPLAPLDVTDIVFIDPVGTGFSHAMGEAKAEDFWGVTADARSVADFIRLWISRNNRWNSPKYIGGESYGTTRSAAVVNQLEGTYNDVALNGILLISTILDFSARAGEAGNEVGYVLNLPTMAATAWYHNALAEKPDDLAAFVEEARIFAAGDYAMALMKGNALQGEERTRIRTRLAAFTGLSEAFLERADLRVSSQRFYKELLRDRGLTVGRLDSRFTGTDFDSAGERPDNDPSFYGIDASYTAAINHYLRAELGVDFDRQYKVISGLGGRWDWRLPNSSDFYFNVAPYIGRALRENAGLRVFNAAGYYDMATPLFGAEYSLTRTGIPADRVTFQYYEAGHMMYIHGPSLEKLLRDVRAFILNGNH